MKKLSFTLEEFFFEDDGIIPNSPYPLLVYRNAFAELGTAGAEFLENIFRKTIGPIPGAGEYILFIITTAIPMRCWVFSRDLQKFRWEDRTVRK